MKKLLTVALVSLFLCSFGQENSFETLNEYFSILDDNKAFMGSIAIMKNGEIVYKNEIGYADIEKKKKINSETKIRIGSISKTFTATMILKAVEEGKLTLDTPLSTFFDEIENADDITISHLLYHKSGIYNFTNDLSYMTYNTMKKNRDEMVTIIKDLGVDFAPNEKTSYSNSGYVLLSFILEDLYKLSYGEILQKQIVSPLGLLHTELGKPIDQSENEAYSYFLAGDLKKSSETDSSIPLGAGAITSTPSDLVTFARALFLGELISEESLRTMKTFDGTMGMGLFMIPFGDSKGLGHTGGIDEFRSVFAYFEEEDIAFAQISNGNNFNLNDISIASLSSVFDVDIELPVFSKIVIDEKVLETYIGTYKTDEIPLDVIITRKGTQLIAQATAQQAFPLDATDELGVFTYRQAGIKLIFSVEKDEMVLEQAGQKITFKKE